MSLFIVLRQDLSIPNPICEVLSIDNSHIKAHHNMIKLIGDKSDVTEISVISKNRIEISNKSFGYVYDTKTISYIYSIQEFTQSVHDSKNREL